MVILQKISWRNRIFPLTSLATETAGVSSLNGKGGIAAEVTGMEGSVVQLQEIFRFERTGTTDEGKVEGHFAATGLRPKFLDEMERRGVPMPEGMFDPSTRF